MKWHGPCLVLAGQSGVLNLGTSLRLVPYWQTHLWVTQHTPSRKQPSREPHKDSPGSAGRSSPSPVTWHCSCGSPGPLAQGLAAVRGGEQMLQPQWGPDVHPVGDWGPGAHWGSWGLGRAWDLEGSDRDRRRGRQEQKKPWDEETDMDSTEKKSFSGETSSTRKSSWVGTHYSASPMPVSKALSFTFGWVKPLPSKFRFQFWASPNMGASLLYSLQEEGRACLA